MWFTFVQCIKCVQWLPHCTQLSMGMRKCVHDLVMLIGIVITLWSYLWNFSCSITCAWREFSDIYIQNTGFIKTGKLIFLTNKFQQCWVISILLRCEESHRPRKCQIKVPEDENSSQANFRSRPFWVWWLWY